MNTETKQRTYHIEGRRWFERTNGNTYHSVRIFSDGEEIAYLPYQYGYGDQCLTTALDWLVDSGNIEAQYHDNGMPKHTGTLFIREHLNSTYSIVDVGRKKDL